MTIGGSLRGGRLWAIVLLWAGLGYVVGIMCGAVAWSVLGPSPMLGATNGSDSGGFLWGFIGGLIGAAVALLAVALVRRRSN